MTRRAAPDWLTQWEYAHRGLHSPGVPENSLAAARAAIAEGKGIECDIQRSADLRPVVFHDWTLERLTERSGAAEDLTASELESLRLFDTEETPVRLDHFLAEIGRAAPVLVEIKSRPGYDVEQTCASVASLLGAGNSVVAVMSFDPRVPKWFAEYSPSLPRGLVATDTLDNGFRGVWREIASDPRGALDFLAIDIRDLPHPLAAAWRASNGPLLTWTVRTGELRRKASLYADALIGEGEGLA